MFVPGHSVLYLQPGDSFDAEGYTGNPSEQGCGTAEGDQTTGLEPYKDVF